MSKIALEEFRDARVNQTTRNDARRIITRVEAALNNPARAGVRWPFELMQNAHDAGPREGNDSVGIEFIIRNEELIASHTGMPFTPQELAALLSGGSSKEFDDEETTGRFGTGFLVTHGLSPHVEVEGILSTQEGNEHFCIELIRDGDEDSIVENIAQADVALSNAITEPDTWIANHPTAQFTYHNVNCDVLNLGLRRLQQALPYLYATCERLGQVKIDMLGKSTLFTPGTTTECELDDLLLRQTEIVISNGSETKQLVAVRIGPKDRRSALLTVVDIRDSDHSLDVPDGEFPRLFVKFPIAGTGFLPFNVILDGQFTPEQERDGISMNGSDRERIFGALSALPCLVRYAVESNWLSANRLAYLAVPDRTIGGEDNSGELTWWHDVMRKTAKATAAQPIIGTSIGRLPALLQDGVESSSFLVPSFDAGSRDHFDYQRIHKLAMAVTKLHIPSRDIAQEWGIVAQGWSEVGVTIDRIGVKELVDRIRIESESICDFPIVGDPFKWLADLFLLIVELEEIHNVHSLVDGILPDQHGRLRNAHDLLVDGGISETIKDIAYDAQIDLRSRLLHNDLWKALSEHGYESARDFISNLLGERLSAARAIEETLEQFDNHLPGDGQFEEGSSLSLLRSSARLVSYLMEEGDIQSLRRCPLLSSANTIVRLTGSSQQILAPVQHWSPPEQPYADLYTKTRILSHRYCDDVTLSQALDPLIRTRLAISTPLHEAVRPEITDTSLLNAMAADGQDTINARVRNESFGQIAFLSTDLVQRCGRDPNLAKLLLKFVLQVAVRNDQSWHQVKQVIGTAPGEQVQLSLRSATWPFELKVRSWVPVPISEESEVEGYAPTPANEGNLRELYEPSWLRDNPDALDLLHQVFGFRQLTLMIDDLDTVEESHLVQLLGDRVLFGVSR